MDEKPWYQSRAYVAVFLTVAIFLVAFAVGLFRQDVVTAAEDAAKVVGIFSPLLGALAIAGLRGAAKVVLVAAIVFGAVACASAPKAEDGVAALDRLNTATKGPESGKSSAENTTTDFPFGPAVAWGANTEATSNAVAARWSPTASNSSSGSLVTGFVQGVTKGERESIEKTVASTLRSDVVLMSIGEEMKSLAAVPVEQRTADWQARVDALRVQYSDAYTRVVNALRDTGVTERLELSQLTTLVVVGIITAPVGTAERAPSEAEVQNLARLLPNVINATKGQTQLLGKTDVPENAGNTSPSE